MMIIIFIALGLLPSFAWLVFFLHEDRHPEPKKLIAKVFLGGLISTAIALIAQFSLNEYLGLPSLSQFEYFFRSSVDAITFSFSSVVFSAFVAAFIFGATEEIAKFIPTYGLIRKNKSFDEPIDAMIYMITAGLGFALVENVSVIITLINSPLSDAFGVTMVRFAGATLLHALTSGIVGFFWAKAIVNWRSSSNAPGGTHAEFMAGRKLVHTWIFFGGLFIASLLHGIFNYLIILHREVLIYPTVFLIIVAFFVFWDFEKLKISSTNNKLVPNKRI